MKIFNYEISFKNKKEDKKTSKKALAVQYPGDPKHKFTNYVNTFGEQQVSYELIDNLYRSTMMMRIINKMAGDATRMNYTIECVNMDNTPNYEIPELVIPIDIKITRKVIRSIIRDMLKYGVAFLFIKKGQEGLPELAYTIHPELIEPQFEEGELINYKYKSSDQEVFLEPEELICFANDAQTGELYGISIFSPIMNILELFLNSQLNTAILIDRFALPIIQWALDKGIEGDKTDPSEILEFMGMLQRQLEAGNDIGTDSSVEARVIGGDNNLIDFVPIMQNQLEVFGITVGIPLQLIGMRGDNLSVTTRQMQSYLDFIRDLQEQIGETLVEAVYMPYLESQGIFQLEKYKEMHINFPIMAVEENSKAINWIAPSVNLGLISRTQGKNALGFKGEAIPVEDIDVPDIQPEVIRPGQRKDPNEEPEPREPKEPDESKRKHE